MTSENTAFDHLPYRPCAGVVLLNSDGMIFTAERLDTPGAWQMPQGGIDNGESPEQAAVRELYEEINVPDHAIIKLAMTQDWVLYDLPPHLLGTAWKGRYRGQKQHWLLARLTADDSIISLDTDHPEFGRWRWSTPQQTLDNIVDFKRSVYQTVLTEFALL